MVEQSKFNLGMPSSLGAGKLSEFKPFLLNLKIDSVMSCLLVNTYFLDHILMAILDSLT